MKRNCSEGKHKPAQQCLFASGMQDLSHFGTQIAEKLQLLSSSSAHRIPRHASSDSTQVLAKLPPASISSRPRKCSTTRDVIRMFTLETNASANADGNTVSTSFGLHEKPTNGGIAHCIAPISRS